MNEYDDLPFDGWPPEPALERDPKPCRHYKWLRTDNVCRCGHVLELAARRRGKSSRRLGGDTERRIERVYGPRKVGEYGEPVDHVGRLWKWQSKATRSLRPRWLARITDETRMPKLPAAITDLLDRMDAYYPALEPVVIRSYVRSGVRPDDYIFRRADGGYTVTPGTTWLDNYGRDEA